MFKSRSIGKKVAISMAVIVGVGGLGLTNANASVPRESSNGGGVSASKLRLCPELVRFKQNNRTCVLALQQALRNKGISVAKDGSFGPKTEAAVKKFQRQAGLDADGRAGLDTQRALLR